MTPTVKAVKGMNRLPQCVRSGKQPCRVQRDSLALGHHLAVHGAGSTIATMALTGQAAWGYSAIRAAVEAVRVWVV